MSVGFLGAVHFLAVSLSLFFRQNNFREWP